MEKYLAKTPRSAPEGNTITSGSNSKNDFRVRAYAITINNWTEHEWALFKLLGDYGCVAPEVGENNTPHMQGYLYFKNKKTFKSLKKKLPRAHIEVACGTPDDNRTYIFGPYTKGDKHKPANPDAIEWGEMPKQGKRTDLDEVKNEIMNGNMTIEDIVVENPMAYHMYGRTLEKIDDIRMSKLFRTEMTKGIWYYGETAVGKSHKAFQGYNPDTHYKWVNDGGWWDNYKQQDTVILNDFRGEIPYNEMLQLVDKWPHEVRRRGRAPLPFLSKTVIVTSSLHPASVYHRREAEDSLAQLLRRFDIIEIKK